MSKTPTYMAWASMIDRCSNPNTECFERYGGRGIAVCDRWRGSFENFLADMGGRPSSKHSIDRYPDNNGDYEPTNCRWATKSQQSRNTRRTFLVQFKGKQVPLSDVADAVGLPSRKIRWRIENGWPVERALSP